jgi:hypothetical protein
LASSEVWWGNGGFFDNWHGAVLAAASVVTTVLFIVGSPWVVRRGTRRLSWASAWAAAAAFLINAHWYILRRFESWMVLDLGIGYFLWWCSFALLAIGLFDLAARNNAAESPRSQARQRPQTAFLPASGGVGR